MEPKCNLIFDSCCDLPLEMVEEESAALLCFNYIIDGKSYKDDFYQSISPHDFYELIRQGATPSTSQPSPADIEKAFRDAIESGVPTVYLCFSSGISSGYSSAVAVLEQLKKEYGEDVPLYIVDLLIGSTPEGLLVLEAMRQRQAGLTAEEMVAWAQEARFFTHIMFMVDDLDALHRGGRIPAGVATAGSALDVKPLLNFDVKGNLGLVGAAHGRKKGLKQIASFYEKNHDTTNDTSPVLIGHADCPDDAQKLQELLAKQNPGLTVIRHNIGATIGSHVGPGMVSIAFWGGDRREKISVADRIAARIKKSDKK